MRFFAMIAFSAAFVGTMDAVQASTLSLTVSGTVTSDVTSGPIPLNSTGIFGPIGTSLVGDTYTETIATNPLLNANVSSVPAGSLLQSYGGTGFGGGVAAPFTVTTTVNGFTFSQTETLPFSNYEYLLYGLTSGLGSMDQVYQGVESNGCSSVYGTCLNTYINAYSTQNPFAAKLVLGQPVTAALLNPGSNTYFTFDEGSNLFTGFYGSINSISVSQTPLPAALPLYATGLGALALLGWRKKRKPAAPVC
jgi:hypothetical protein